MWFSSHICCVIGMAFASQVFAQDQPQDRANFRQKILERFDKDGDGRLSQEERAAARAELRKRFPQRNNARQPKEQTWTINGEQRTALIYLPEKKSEKPVPLVFGFHGHGGSSRNADRSFGLQNHWPEAVVVYMQGLPTPGRLTDPEGKRNGWQHDIGAQDDRDLKFFDVVLATLMKQGNIDSNRIYSMGHSNGGGFTYLLWASRPDVFAAVAPSAAGARALRNSGIKPVPVMHVAGKKDTLVKFAWQERTMERVREINGCQSAGKPWGESGTEYPSATNTPFVAIIHEGTHKFPANAPELMVKFFQQHDKSTKKKTTSEETGS